MPHQSLGLGFVSAAISVLGFGSNFVPAKAYPTGDGMFFQLTQALGIFTVGVVVQLIRGDQSVFRPYAMVGGFIWCTGNCMCPQIINFTGLAVGSLIWNGCNLITGWCMGEWGLFGTNPSEKPSSPLLNVFGALIALVATATYFFIEPPEEGNGRTSSGSHEGYKELPSSQMPTAAGSEGDVGTDQDSKHRRLEVVKSVNSDPVSLNEQTNGFDTQRLIGVLMAILAGFLFGVNFAPPNQLIEDETHVDGNKLHYSSHGIDYVFSHFTGILLTSLMWFLLYCILKKNKPLVNNELFIPGWLSGVAWGIAQAFWFVANDNLGLTTAYPIITTGPGIVASLWAVCMFGEVKGKRNRIVLAIAFFLSFVAVSMITVSKVK